MLVDDELLSMLDELGILREQDSLFASILKYDCSIKRHNQTRWRARRALGYRSI